MMVTLALRNLTKILAGVCLVLVASIGYAKTSETPEVGAIGQIKGSGVLERGKDIVIDGNVGVAVRSMDEAVTANGTMRINFIDDTRVELTEQSRLVIDEFVYDPSQDLGSLSMKASLGTVRYASGQIAKRYKQNVKISTPSATIGVRGTDFIMTVDEFGGSMITLLPSCDVSGFCYVGEITVETDAGFVIMNQAFQATSTLHSFQKPTPPIVIDVTEDQINNLLILRKKKPIWEAEEEERIRRRKLADFLDIDFLEFSGLDVDILGESTETLWVTALDETDYMLGDLLYDILDQLNLSLMALFKDELDVSNAALLKQDTNVYGFDATTGIRLDLEDPNWIWKREDNGGAGTIQIKMHNEYGYSLNIQQGDFEIYDYRLGEGANNTIDIIQTGQ
jgi:hypothetical protein